MGFKGTCDVASVSCNCEINDEVWREDEGNLTDKSSLPVTEIRAGDTGASTEYLYLTLGPLYCQGDDESCRFSCCYCYLFSNNDALKLQGQFQDFNIEGAQMMWSAHHGREASNIFNSAGILRASLNALETLTFQMLSHAIPRFISKHSDTRLKKKYIVDQNLEGARAY